MWTEHDESSKTKVCILGTTAARNLFGDEDPVRPHHSHRALSLSRPRRARVERETPFGEDQDDQIAMPIGSMRSRIMRTPPGFAGVLFVSATAPETADRAVSQVASILRQRHHVASDRQPDFEIRTQKEFQTIQSNIYNALTLVGVIMAFIQPRRRRDRRHEHHARQRHGEDARDRHPNGIGAREADIRTQFLAEAVILACLGGAAGAALAIGTVGVFSLVFGWKMCSACRALT